MEYKKGSFGDELAILQAIDGIEVLQDGDPDQVFLSFMEQVE